MRNLSGPLQELEGFSEFRIFFCYRPKPGGLRVPGRRCFLEKKLILLRLVGMSEIIVTPQLMDQYFELCSFRKYPHYPPPLPPSTEDHWKFRGGVVLKAKH